MFSRPKIEVTQIAKLQGHTGSIYSLQNPSEGKLISCGTGGLVAKWDIYNPELGTALAKVTEPIFGSTYHKEKQLLYFAENGAGVHALNWLNRNYLGSIQVAGNSFFDLKCYEDYLMVAGGDGILTLLYTEPFQTVKRLKVSEKSLRRVAIIESLNLVALSASDNQIYLLDAQDFSLIKILEGHKNSVFALGFHKETGLLVSGSRDAHLNFWDSSLDFRIVESVPAHLFAINDLDFSADGRWMATCSMDKSVKIWSMEHLQLIKVLDKARHAGHGTSVNAVKWLDKNYTLASGGDDRVISVWNLNFTEN